MTQEVHTLEHVDQYLLIGKESDASDIHLGVNAQPIWRRFGSARDYVFRIRMTDPVKFVITDGAIKLNERQPAAKLG